MSQFFRRKFTYFVTGLLLLSGGFLFSNPVLSAWDANVYNKPYNGTLTAIEWNNLLTDFPALWLPATFKGPVTIGTSTPTTLTVNGTITATNFLGSFTGTLGAQNVSSGAFGSNTGEGNYSFPGNVGIGTTAPGKQLSVVGNIESLITLGSELITNGTFDSALTGWTNGSMNTFVWDSGSMHIVQTGTGWPSVYTTVPLTPGNIYYYSIDVTVNSGSFLFLQQGPNTTIAELSTSNSFSGYFIASSDSANTIRLKGSNAPGDWNIDNISIQPYISGGMTTPFLAVNDSDLFAGYGKVGVGTTKPSRKFVVEIDSGYKLAMFQNRGLDANSPAEFVLQHSYNDTDVAANMIAFGAAPAGREGFIWRNNSDRLRLHSDGKFGFVDLEPSVPAILGSKVSIAGNLSVGASYYSSAAPVSGAIIEGNVGIGTTTTTATKLTISGGTNNVIDVLGGQIAGLNSTPVNSDHAVPLGYLQSNYTPSGTVAGGVGNGTTGQTLRHNGTSWVANSALFNNGTNVGIGTTAPGAKLQITDSRSHVSGDLTGSDALLRLYNNYNSDVAEKGAVISFEDNYLGINRTTRAAIKGGTATAGNTANGFLAFYTDAGTANSMQERMRINQVGNVGIGTTNPVYPLNIQNPSGQVNSLRLQTNDWVSTSVGSNLDFYFGATTGNTFAGIQARDLGAASNADLILQQYGSNVGIGTTGPGYKLEVSTSGTASARTVASYIPSLSDGGWNSLVIGSSLTEGLAGQLVFVKGTTGASYADSYLNLMHYGDALGSGIVIKKAGNVGIGTTNPTTKLYVNGGTGNAISAGGGHVAGLNSTPTNSDHAVPLGYLQNNYALKGTGVGSAFVQGGNSFGAAGTLGTNDNNLLNIETNNAVRMTVAANGKVGVGTTVPQNKFTVIQSSGGTGATGTDGTGGIRVAWSSGFGVSLDAWDGGNPFWGIVGFNANTPTVKIGGNYNTGNVWLNPSGGNVGIGTTVPNQKLTVLGNAMIGRLSENRGILIQGAVGATHYSWMIGAQQNVDAALEFTPSTVVGGTTFTTPVMTIKQSGNVGIGTTAPIKSLQLSYVSASTDLIGEGLGGGTAGKGLLINNTQATAGVYANLDFRANNADGRISFVYNAINDGDFHFITDNSGSPETKLFIENAGNVGIGTTTPITKLHVNGGTGNAIYAGGGQVAGLNSTPTNSDHAVPLGYLQANYTPSGASAGGVGNGTTGQTLRHNGTSWIANSVIFNNGTNVGIGVTNPLAKLHVGGGVIMKRTAVADANYTVQADDYIIGYASITANRTLTIPAALCTPGRFFVVVDESGNASGSAKIIIDPVTYPIIGLDTLPLEDSFNSVYVFCGNSAWYIL